MRRRQGLEEERGGDGGLVVMRKQGTDYVAVLTPALRLLFLSKLHE